MPRVSRSEYEKRLLDEIRNLQEPEISKVLKLIHFLKEEILEIEGRKEDHLQLFWDSFGSWRDERPPEEIIRELYKSRQSSSRDIQL